MKSVSLLAIVAALLTPAPAQSPATITQGVISTGRVLEVDPRNGSMILRAENTGTPLLFRHLDRAPVFADGTRASFGHIVPMQHVTVYYQVAGDRWVVSRVLLQNPLPPPAPVPALTPAERKALFSRAANDGDITTEPGVKARIDDDITTRPGFNDPAERDRTKPPR